MMLQTRIYYLVAARYYFAGPFHQAFRVQVQIGLPISRFRFQASQLPVVNESLPDDAINRKLSGDGPLLL
ncbi:hypothetical protein DSO57_1027443 [Entomophthora muscae]|uniref:Uncharacterized protein n=1 Tax=Entomophthora muscae TaxID=34485 RepID=A0ACC2RGG7_9FUNG|nr:hypothetical protein DSO57_1027443 [Entomophthora muscae]